MRRPNFKGWVSRELKYLSGEDTLNLRRLAFLAQSSRPRLRERLVFYALVTKQAPRLKGYLYDESFIAEFDEISGKLKTVSLDNLSKKTLAKLPPRYQKAFGSFKVAYLQIDSRNESKRLRWEKTVLLQKQKGLSNADIYKSLGLNMGNINAYLKHGDIDRVTLATSTKIMKFLMAS